MRPGDRPRGAAEDTHVGEAGRDCPKFSSPAAPRSRPVLIASATALTDRNGQTVRVGDVTRTTTAGIVLKSVMIALVSRCLWCAENRQPQHSTFDEELYALAQAAIAC